MYTNSSNLRNRGGGARDNTYDNRRRKTTSNQRRRRTSGQHGRHRTTTTTSWRQEIGLVVASLLAIAAWYLTPISDLIVDVLIQTIPIDKDIELQQASLKSFPYKTVKNPQWTSEVKRIGKDLVEHLPDDQKRHYNWEFGVIHADFINAFALPGGAIRVTDTLLRTLDLTKGELAALLGHEIGHVVSRHSQRHLLCEQLISNLLNALVYEDYDDEKETFGQALGELITKSASWLGRQKFSRRDEYQADAVAWDLLVPGVMYSPRSLESLLSKLQSLETAASNSDDTQHGNSNDDKKDMSNLIAAWSRTHPATTDRVQAVREKWKELPMNDRRRLSLVPV